MIIKQKLMKKKKIYKTRTKAQVLEEPSVDFAAMTINVFNSFEEEAEFVALQSMNTSYEERLKNLEILRKQVYYNYLLPNGEWQAMKPTIIVLKPHTNDISQ